MSRFSKTIFVIGSILLIYGYLCRIFKIYFFWDSKTIGWITLFIALLAFWVDLRRTRRQRGKKTIWVTIGICFLIFGLGILPVTVFIAKASDAYVAAIEYLNTDPKIKEEIGNVKGFGLIPTGSLRSTSINGSESGVANFEIIVRGDRKYKDVTVHLNKSPDMFWTVTSIK